MSSRCGLYQKWLKKRRALMGVLGILVAILLIAAACGEEAIPTPAPVTPTPQPIPTAVEPTPTEEPPTSTPPRGLALSEKALIEKVGALDMIVERLDLGEARDQLMINLIQMLAERTLTQEELVAIHKLIEKLYTPVEKEVH